MKEMKERKLSLSSSHIHLYTYLPVTLGFDHLDLGLNPQLDVQSKAQEEQRQKHIHHFVE